MVAGGRRWMKRDRSSRFTSPAPAGSRPGRSRKSFPPPASSRCIFFQAEDGIRDLTVTGVQTCALPISIAGALLSLVPLGPNTYLADPPIGVIMIFAIIGFFPIVTLLAGWASNSKYPFLGGLRALHQMISYEIPLILSLLGVVILSGTLDIMKVVVSQEGIWYILLQPIGAIVFFIASLAELERIPFDLPEADTELVAGWVTECSVMGFGAVFLGIYIKLYALSGLFTAFFLGGWLGPSFLPPELWFLLKTFFVMTAMLIPRGTMPRIRIDLMIRVGWTRLLVLSFANIFLTMLLVSLGIFRIGGL